jgi:hypothetical protein
LEIVFCWLSKIPNVVWSAVIASCLTFIGVFLTNRGNERRQASLLEHEKQKFQAEQRLALKKEVFLNVASSFANVLEVVPKLVNLDFSQKEIDTQLSGHSGIVAKSYLAAKEDSVSEILNYSAEIGEAFLKLMPVRAVLLDHKQAIEIYQDTINSANAEKNRIAQIVKEMNVRGSNDQSTYNYLRNIYETQSAIIDSNSKSKAEQEEIIKPLHISFSKECISQHGRLLSLIPPMTIALRNELENNGNSEVFIKALNENISRMNSAFEKLFDQAEA